MKITNSILHVIVFVIIVLSVKFSYSQRHYVCNDSTLIVSKSLWIDKNSLSDSTQDIINAGDTVFLVPGVNLTLDPDTINEEFYWHIWDFISCDKQYYNEGPLTTNYEGKYGYGSSPGYYNIPFYVIVVDSIKLTFHLNKNIEQEGYTLSVPDYFISYSWSTGDTTHQIFINESGTYQLEVWDHCNNQYTKSIYIELNPPFTAGEYDPETMVYDSLNYTVNDHKYYSLDLNFDGADDLEFDIGLWESNAGYSFECLLIANNNFYVSVDELANFVTGIRQGDDVNNKLYWTNGVWSTIYINKYTVYNLANGCNCGWDDYSGTPYYIGFKHVSGEQIKYGWLEIELGWGGGRIRFIGYATQKDFTAVDEVEKYEIKVYPNPLTNYTKFNYQLNQPEEVTITIFNHLGEQVDVIHQQQSSGKQEVIWSPLNLPAGIYYFRMQAGDQAATGTMVLAR